MKPILRILGFVFAVLAIAAFVQAQDRYPSRPIRILVGFSAGGSVDFTARVLAQHMSDGLGQPVIVENKLGAAGVLAGFEVVKAAPDGYTLFMANVGSSALAPNMMTARSYDPVNDFTAIGQAVAVYFVVAVPASHVANSISEFIEWAKNNEGKVNFASGGNGSVSHLNGELLNQLAGLRMAHVPYKGAPPAVTGLIAGQTHILIDVASVLTPQVKAGKLKALAVTSPTRDSELSHVPTVREAGYPALETAGWQGLVGPPGLPKEIVARLAVELKRLLSKPDVRERFRRVGQPVVERGPDEFAAFIKAENERWISVIKTSGARIE